jgi:hypothetical protein
MKQASYIDVLSQELMSCLEKDVILVYLSSVVFFAYLTRDESIYHLLLVVSNRTHKLL